MPVAQSVSMTRAVLSRPMACAVATSRSYSPRESSRPSSRNSRRCVLSGFTRHSSRPMTVKNLFSPASMAFTVAAEYPSASSSLQRRAASRSAGPPASHSEKRLTSRTYFSTVDGSRPSALSASSNSERRPGVMSMSVIRIPPLGVTYILCHTGKPETETPGFFPINLMRGALAAR